MTDVVTAPCWHCGITTGLRSKRIGAALCQAACRDAAERLVPVPVPITSMRGVLLARTAPESLCRRWRTPDGAHFLVPLLVAVKLEHIGNGPEGGAVRSSSTDASRKRPADAPPEDGPPSAPMPLLPADTGGGFLDRLPRDIRYELAKYVLWPGLITMAVPSQRTYDEMVGLLNTLHATNIPDLVSVNLSIIEMLDAAGVAAARNDRATFNLAMHIALVQFIREISATTDQVGKSILLGLVLYDQGSTTPTPRYLDYALLCDSGRLASFMWLCHLRRTYPDEAFIGSKDHKGIDVLTEWKTSHTVRTVNLALVHLLRVFVRAHCAVHWYHSTYALSLNAIEFSISDVHEPFTGSIISDRPLALVPTDDISTDDDDDASSSSAGFTIEALPTTTYVENNATRTRLPTLAEGLYAPGESYLYRKFNDELLAIIHRHGYQLPTGHIIDRNPPEIARLYPSAGLSDLGGGITTMPSGIFTPAAPAPSSSLSAAAAAATVDEPSVDWSSTDSDSDDDWSDDD